MAEIIREAAFSQPRSSGIHIVGGSTDPSFAEKIVDSINERTEAERSAIEMASGIRQVERPQVQPTAIERRQFTDRELFDKYEESLRGGDVYIVQTHHLRSTEYEYWSPNDAIQEHVFMVDAAKGASATHVTAVSPYLGYSLQDKKNDGRVAISSRRVVRQLVDAGAERLMSMDLHAPQIQGFTNNEPFENLFASPVLLRMIGEWAADIDPEELVVVSPDAGRAKLNEFYAHKLGSGLAIIDKARSKDSQRIKAKNIIGEVAGKHCVVIDDIIGTAKTLSASSGSLTAAGAKSCIAVATHGVLVGDAPKHLNDSDYEKIMVTDTISQAEPLQTIERLEVGSVAPIFADAIWKIHHDESVSDIFEEQRTDF